MMLPTRAILRLGAILALLVATFWVATRAHAQANSKVVPGEVLVTVPAGTPRAAVDNIAKTLNSKVVYAFGTIDFERATDAYQLRAEGGPLTQAQTLAAVDQAKKTPGVKNAFPNGFKFPFQTSSTATPNDPRFSIQWNMKQINLPLAWTLEKGQADVVVAVIDTGTDIDHPDFDPSRIFKPYNSITQTSDPRPAAGSLHGTMTAGMAAAWTNNSKGQAGATWQNVKLMPINAGSDSGGFAQADLLRAYQYVQTQASTAPSMRFVINLSLGGQATTDTPDPATLAPDDLGLLNAAKSGILVVASAGNSFQTGNPPTLPASLAAINGNVICVAATDSNGLRTSYSEARPYTTVAAPGGDGGQGLGIPILVPTADTTYAIAPDAQHPFDGGTSAAAPHVAGVAALILSVPGVKVADVKPLLQATAKKVPGAVVPGADYGYGIVDAYAALLRVAFAVTILEPSGTGGKASGNNTQPEPIETLNPTIRIQVSQIMPQNLTIRIDGGDPIPQCVAGQTDASQPCFQVQNVTVTGPDPNDSSITVPLTYEAVITNAILSPGPHRLEVVGTRPAAGTDPALTVTDLRNVTVTPLVISAGRSLVSFPYYEYVDSTGKVILDPHDPGQPNRITPQTYLGTNFRLARWLPDQERYAFYSSFGQSDIAAGFTPTDVITRQDGDPATPAFAKWPVGLGFWLDSESNKPILTKGQPLTDRAFVIPLKANPNAGENVVSWNMIGDPFPFDVPFNSLLVDTPLGRISIAEAANRGYILPNIYSYDGGTGYTFQTLPAGALRAWQGHWVGLTSKVDLNLVVPPAKVSRSAALSTRAAGTSGGWIMQIGAHAKSLHDSYNFIGTSSSAKDGYDRLDVQKPPMTGPYVSLGVSNTGWSQRAGIYAQDIRSAGSSKAWTLVANTDQPNTDVTLSWNTASLPKGVRLTLKDESNGQTFDMRSRAAVTFNTGSQPVPRTFVVTSRQAVGNTLRIANLNVRSTSRGSGTNVIGFNLTGDATYEVRVLGSTGNTVATVGSRAAAAAGDVSVVWNGRDNSGKTVAAGTYLVQVRATTTEGDSIRAIQPFTIVR